MNYSTLTDLNRQFCSWSKFRLSFCLVVFGFLAYAGTLQYPFVHDDVVFVQNNPRIARLDHLGDIFFGDPTEQNWAVANTYYRPLLEIWNRLVFSVFGANPAGFHFANILVHIFNSIIVFHLLFFIFRQKIKSFLVALLFLLHPVQTQAVACISGISNLLYTLLLLISLFLYVYVRRSRPAYINVAVYFLGLVFFTLALLAKEQAAVLPGLLILYEFCFRCPFPEPRMRKYVQVSGFAIVLAGYLMFRRTIAGVMVSGLGEAGQENWLRWATIPKQILIDLGLLIFPSGLHYYRSIDILQGSVWFSVGFVILAAAGTFFVLRLSKESRSSAVFAVGWFIIALLPTINIIPLIIEYSHIFLAEHFLYLPSIGFFMFLVTVAEQGFFEPDRDRKAARVFVCGVLIVCLMTLAVIRQNRYWRSEVALFERSVRYEKNLGRVYALLGKAHYQEKNFIRAEENYRKAKIIFMKYVLAVKEGPSRPFYLGFLKGICFDLAHAYESLGQLDEAIAEYEEALRIDPKDNVIVNNLGAVYLRLGNFDRAAVYFRDVLRSEPRNVMAMTNLAYCHIQRGDVTEAELLLEKAVSINPEYVPAQQNLRTLKGRQ